jgi:hypothetical protein
MKKTLLTALAMTCAVGVFAQGTVTFNNRNGATTHVYGPTPGGTRINGNSSIDNPAGATVYPGLLVGTAGGLAASTTIASLLGAPGAVADENLLVLASGGGTTTFRTGAASGNIAPGTATFNNIPQDAALGTFQLVAWDNSSGLYSTWALAKQAWLAGSIAAGTSALFQLTSIGGQINTPPLLTTLTSFNMYVIPEPTTMALAGLGAAALLIFRRRK